MAGNVSSKNRSTELDELFNTIDRQLLLKLLDSLIDEQSITQAETRPEQGEK